MASPQSYFDPDEHPTVQPDVKLRPVDFDRVPAEQSYRRRPLRAFARFVIAVAIGVVGTLAWQSYGDQARAYLAASSPKLAWVAPPAGPVARSVPETVAAAPAAPAAPAIDPQQITAMSLTLAAMQQRVEQVAAGQQQLAGDIAKLQSDEQEIIHKISAPPPAPRPAPVRKPPPPPAAAAAPQAPSLTLAPPVH